MGLRELEFPLVVVGVQSWNSGKGSGISGSEKEAKVDDEEDPGEGAGERSPGQVFSSKVPLLKREKI